VDERRAQDASQVPPLGDQALVQAVPLVVAGEHLLFPFPLHHRGLEERGRCVTVVLEELRRAHPIVGEVEAAMVKGRRLLLPGPPQEGDYPGGDTELREEVAVEDRLAGEEAEPLQLGGRRLQLVDLVGREAVVGRLVPVGLAVRGMPDEAELLHFLLPARPRLDPDPLHFYSPMPALA